MSAQSLAAALGGHRVGDAWMARCPAHEDTTPSLSISIGRDRKMLVHCHAGCEQAAVISALRALGLWEGEPSVHQRSKEPARQFKADGEGDERRGAAAGGNIWCAGCATAGTLIETYLRFRRITIAAPTRLKFHPCLKHRTGSSWPAMVALVTRGPDDSPWAFIARTWRVTASARHQ